MTDNPDTETKKPHEKPQIEIVSDEDWKKRVKAEDAALDEKLKAEAGSRAAPQPTGEAPDARKAAESAAQPGEPPVLPPAQFGTLLAMLSTQAMVALGLLPNPATDKIEPQLQLARHFIDLLAVLEEKTQGNLSPEESKGLTSTLHELRMAYVEQAKK